MQVAINCSDVSSVRVGYCSDIEQFLCKFASHGLYQLDAAILMNRVDTKFLVPMQRIFSLLDLIIGEYTILEIDHSRLFRYQTCYFDTPDLDFYHMHRRGKLNRFKVRLRSYLDSRNDYLEVKFKNNKKRTLKSRIEVDSHEDLNLNAHREFLFNSGIGREMSLLPSLRNSYQRISLANEAREERITIDIGLESKSLASADASQMHLNELCIVELKQRRYCRNSPFFDATRALQLRPTRFSKYCIGMSMSENQYPNPKLKYNRFKPITRRIEQSLVYT